MSKSTTRVSFATPDATVSKNIDELYTSRQQRAHSSEHMKQHLPAAEVVVELPTLSAKDSSLTEDLGQVAKLDLRFDRINGYVQQQVKKDTSLSQSEVQPQEQKILSGITGAIHPGEVLAIMGPSGCGKTTLLTILGARDPKQLRVEGTVTLNEQPITKDLKRRIAFITQDDLLFPYLTVYETLFFAAMLRLPQSMSRQKKLERVEKVIDELGLLKARNTIIGGPVRRGVSGGERKRVSVGNELLINPSLLLLDEPTSGLDSTTAMQLIRLINQLASAGRTVATTIHQPSSQLYRLLNKTMLLSEGRIMYYGPSSEAIAWFEKKGLLCPYGMNTADFILDLANGDFSQAEGDFSGTKIDLVNAYSRQLATSSRQTFVVRPSADKASADQKLKTGFHVIRICCNFFVDERWGATYFQQYIILLHRSIRSRRFEYLNIDKLVQLILVGVVVGLYWFQNGTKMTLQSSYDNLGLLFFEVAVVAMLSLFAAVFTFPSEHSMVVKERQSGMYRLSAYFLARITADVPLEWSIPGVYVTVTYFLSGLRRTLWAFLANLTATLLVLTAFSATGSFIGAVTMNVKRGQTMALITFLAMLLAAGFYIRQIPEWLRWVQWLSIILYGYRINIAIEFTGRQYYDCGELAFVPNPETDSRCREIDSLQNALRLSFDPEGSPWLQIVLLVAVICVMRLASYVALMIRTNP